jgi:hypothetical protein
MVAYLVRHPHILATSLCLYLYMTRALPQLTVVPQALGSVSTAVRIHIHNRSFPIHRDPGDPLSRPSMSRPLSIRQPRYDHHLRSTPDVP